MLEIKDLTVKVDDKIILNNFNITINDGEIHVLMGPNGTGKSTICKAIFNHPDYIIEGSIKYNGTELTKLDVASIGKLGLFLLAQNPVEIPGITNAELIRSALSEKENKPIDIFKFNKKLNEVCEIINLPKSFVHRDINFNMSGGEKKKNELLSLFMLEPKFIILDEIDSGLDIDALKEVGNALNKYYEMEHPSILIVTHHQAILEYFKDGHITKSGTSDLAKEIEKHGFKANVINGSKNDE